MRSKDKLLEDKGKFEIPSTSELGLLPDVEKVSTSPKEVEGRIYAAMALNLSSSRNPSLFDEFDELEEKEISRIKESDKSLQIERNYRPVSYSAFQYRIIFHFLSFLSTFQDDEDVIKATRHLNETLTGKDSNFYTPIARKICISNISKKLLKRKTQRDREKIFNEIDKISKAYQAITYQYRDDNNKLSKLTVARTLIKIDDSSIIYKDGIPEIIGIIFQPLFFDRIITCYAPIKPYLQDLWSEKEIANNPIFPSLLAHLSSLYYDHIRSAKDEEEKLKANPEQELNTREKILKEKLTLPLSTYKIRDKALRDFTSSRKAKKDFLPLLQVSIDYLIKYGIITKDTYISENKDMVYFVYNYNFKNQAIPTQLTKELKA